MPPKHGGSTDFALAYETGTMHVPSLQPRAGSGLLLAHDVLHSGAPLRAGHKFILRTEVLYHGGGAAAGPGLGSLAQYNWHWPDAADGRDASVCPLEHLLAGERECPFCS